MHQIISKSNGRVARAYRDLYFQSGNIRTDLGILGVYLLVAFIRRHVDIWPCNSLIARARALELISQRHRLNAHPRRSLTDT